VCGLQVSRKRSNTELAGYDDDMVDTSISHTEHNSQPDEDSSADEDYLLGDNVERSSFLYSDPEDSDSSHNDGNRLNANPDDYDIESEISIDQQMFRGDIFAAMSSNALLLLKLLALAIYFKLPNTVLNVFLALLHFLGHNVPMDARTIRRTPRNGPSSDNFHHFGLTKKLIEKVKSNCPTSNKRELLLQINVDGIPLYKSSKIGFWPILCFISNINDHRLFIVSIFCGNGKPDCIESFFGPFIEEMERLESNGLSINGVRYSVKIDAIVCDSPARAFVKSIAHNSGGKGCERCTVSSRKQRGRNGRAFGGTTFIHHPNNSLRTDSSFRRRQDPKHHQKGDLSPLTRLSVDMVKSFPLDYMHLICLGVVKRLIGIWVDGSKKDLPNKLYSGALDEVNQMIKACSKYFSSEFNRKSRDITDYKHWKAVEFRSFLLYSGVIVLKGILPPDKYDHFLLLHVALRILCSPNSTEPQLEFAKRCLNNLVSLFDSLYGRQHIVYNVHNLLHLTDDCIYFKRPLASYSSFPFESYLGNIKRLLCGTRKPLSQLYRRISEIDAYEAKKFYVQPRSAAHTTFQSATKTDSFYAIGNSVVVKVVRVVGDQFWGIPLELQKVSGKLVDFYNHPLLASNIGTVISNGLGKGLAEVAYSVELLHKGVKCVALPSEAPDSDDDYDYLSFVIIPLLHQCSN
jgi:hypothetical protein